jgi:hypothetical protein
LDRVSTISVTYNSSAVILDALHSIVQQDGAVDTEIVVVDNQSADGTAVLIREHFPDAGLYVSNTNRGFGGGNNYGFQFAHGDYIAFINPDLKLQPDTLAGLVAYLKANPSAGIVGPRTLDDDGQVALTARSPYTATRITLTYLGLARLFPALLRREERRVNWHATGPETVPWLQGSCLVMPRHVFEKVEGFDENFFLYAEDVDLCRRVQDAGWQVVYHPGVQVTHVGGTSTSDFPYIRVRGYHLSPLYLFRKHNQPNRVRLLKLVFTIELLSKSLWRRLFNLMSHHPGRARQARAELKVLWECWRY